MSRELVLLVYPICIKICTSILNNKFKGARPCTQINQGNSSMHAHQSRELIHAHTSIKGAHQCIRNTSILSAAAEIQPRVKYETIKFCCSVYLQCRCCCLFETLMHTLIQWWVNSGKLIILQLQKSNDWKLHFIDFWSSLYQIHLDQLDAVHLPVYLNQTQRRVTSRTVQYYSACQGRSLYRVWTWSLRVIR